MYCTILWFNYVHCFVISLHQEMPGAIHIVDASDIPPNGKNNAQFIPGFIVEPVRQSLSRKERYILHTHHIIKQQRPFSTLFNSIIISDLCH